MSQAANHSSLAAASQVNSGPDEHAKFAGVLAAVFAEDAAIIVAVIEQIFGFGAPMTAADSQELAVAASLATAEAVAAIVQAVFTVITEMPQIPGGKASTGCRINSHRSR
jgi:hypothetical protein